MKHHFHHFVRSAILAKSGIFPFSWERRLQKNETMHVEELQQLSMDKLKRLISHAYENVPWYREQMRKIGFLPSDFLTLEDIEILPVLKKDDIRVAGKALRAEDSKSYRTEEYATGGSTGAPLNFLRSLEATTVGVAAERRMWRWYGASSPGVKMAYIWGDDRDISKDVSTLQLVKNKLLGVSTLNAFQLNDERCKQFLSMLNQKKPDIIYGYSTALACFAIWLEENHRALSFAPKSIHATAEVLSPEHREVIERALRAPVHNFYGSRDCGPMAGERVGGEGLSVFSDIAWLEILRDDGTPCGLHEPGRVVVTKLHEYAMPFLRYENGDRAMWMDHGGENGMPFRRIAAPCGRIGDFIETPDGKKIHGEFFTHLFYDKPDVERFQVRQEQPDRLVVLVQSQKEVAGLDSVLSSIQQKFGSDDASAVSLQQVDYIAPGSSGKHRFVLPYQALKKAS